MKFGDSGLIPFVTPTIIIISSNDSTSSNKLQILETSFSILLLFLELDLGLLRLLLPEPHAWRSVDSDPLLQFVHFQLGFLE